MRADRLLSLVLLLQARGQMTAAELASELEVSVRTIYRDLEALGAAGVPVYAEAGPGGGCRLLDGYRFPLGPLSSQEAAALLVLGVPEVFAELGLGDGTLAAHHRLLATSGLAGGRRSPLVHLDMPRWFRSPAAVPCLPTLAEALRSGRRVAVLYQKEEGSPGRSRAVGPLGLVNKAGTWYFVGETAGGRTTVFRVGRVKTARLLDDRFALPPDFDLAAYWKSWSEEFQASRPRLAVELRASPIAVQVLAEVLGDGAHDAIAGAGPPAGDGWLTMTLVFESKEAAAHRLLGFGDMVEVLSPEEVRQQLVRTAQAALRRYRLALPDDRPGGGPGAA